MARARDLRPEFFTDTKVGTLPFGARLLFQGLWCHSDLRGVFEHSPMQLRALVFPYDEGLTSLTVAEWLSELAARGMITVFQAGGKSWGALCNWTRHQTVSTREVEIGSLRPWPPGWADPPDWAAKVESAIKQGRKKRNVLERSGTILEPNQNTTPSPSPAPAPTPSPASSPSPAPARPDAGGGDGARQPIQAYNSDRIRSALQANDLLAVVDGFHGNLVQADRPAQWMTAAHGRIVPDIAVVLWEAFRAGDPIREPSGLRAALAAWDGWAPDSRKAARLDCARDLGLPIRARPEAPP